MAFSRYQTQGRMPEDLGEPIRHSRSLSWAPSEKDSKDLTPLAHCFSVGNDRVSLR